MTGHRTLSALLERQFRSNELGVRAGNTEIVMRGEAKPQTSEASKTEPKPISPRKEGETGQRQSV
jgi:hypothetical protein